MNKQDIKIVNDDCISYLKKIEDNSIDLVVTSPPYNCGIDYNIYDDNKPWDEYVNWCNEWIKELYRVCKDDGRIAINVLIDMGIDHNKIRISPMNTFTDLITNNGFKIMGYPLWADNHRSKNTAWGSWKSASSPYVYNPFEVIILAYKKSIKKINKGIDTISKEDFMMGCSGIWNICPDTNSLTKATFPVSLPKLCIELLSFENDLVLDPFSGSGSTGIACLMTNRKYIGIEMDKKYYKISKNRIDNYSEQTLLF